MTDKVKDAAASMIANLSANTGRSLEQWHQALHKQGFKPSSKHGEIMKYLKGDAAITHGYANLIAMKFRESTSSGDMDLVAAQYKGDKTGLRPAYDKLIKLVSKFGKDVEIAPKKSYVSLRRSKQFALIQPSTKTRIDVGINLQNRTATGRLEMSGTFNAMVSHRVRIEDTAAIDAELIARLREAYEGA